MLASDLVEEARDYHESFVPERHQPRLLFRALRTLEERFFQEMATIAEGAVSAETVFDAAAIDTAIDGTALALPAYTKLLVAVFATSVDQLVEVTLMQSEVSGQGDGYEARVMGRELYLAQPSTFQAEMSTNLVDGLRSSSPFLDGQALRITYVPKPAAIPQASTTMLADDDARGYFVGGLIMLMAGRTKGLDVPTKKFLMDAGTAMMQGVRQTFAERGANEATWYVR
jgi:hypothetical protein